MGHSKKVTTAIISIMHDIDNLTSVMLYQGCEEELAGEILKRHYPSPQAIEELLKGGNLVTLGTDVGLCSYCKDGDDTTAEHHAGLSELFGKYVSQVDLIYIYGLNCKWYCHKCKD